MKTVCTDDTDENMEVVELFIDGRGDGGGLMELARVWNV